MKSKFLLFVQDYFSFLVINFKSYLNLLPYEFILQQKVKIKKNYSSQCVLLVDDSSFCI